MSKADFFLQLQERLRGLPVKERQNIIHVYEDLFRQAEAGGKSEREIIESLGFISVPADPRMAEAMHKSPCQSRISMIIASVALGLFNLIFILGPFLAVSALLFSLFLAGILFAFSPVLIVIGTGIPADSSTLLLELFAALAFTGLGVLLLIGLWRLNSKFIRLVKRYYAHNLRLIKGE